MGVNPMFPPPGAQVPPRGPDAWVGDNGPGGFVGLVAPPVRPIASTATQLAALLAASSAIVTVCVVIGDYLAVGFAEAALVGGIAVGGLTSASARAFRPFAGWAAGMLVATVAIVAWAVAAANLGGDVPVPAEAAAYVGLFVAGLDWQRADRLRALVVVSGLGLVPFLASSNPVTVVLGLIWFGAAAVTLWLVERDVGRWSWRIAPAGPPPPTDAGAGWAGAGSVARVTGLAVVVAVGCALLFGSPSCERSRDQSRPSMVGSAYEDLSVGERTGRRATGGAGRSDGSGSRRVGRNDGNSVGRGDGSGSGGGWGIGSDADRGTGNGSGGQAVGGGETPRGAERGLASDPSLPPDWGPVRYVLLIVLLAGVAAVVAVLLHRAAKHVIERRKRKAVRPPAYNLLERLIDEGRKRGRPRRASETVSQYAAALAATVLPDARLLYVGDILTAAYFAPEPPGPETLRWAEEVVDAVVEQLAEPSDDAPGGHLG